MPDKSPDVPADLAQEQPTVRVLVDDVRRLAEDGLTPSGARWTLAEPDRQLDANLIHLPAGRRVDTHAEPDVDVLLVVVAGGGTLGAPGGEQDLAEGNLIWLPRGSTRSIGAGDHGLSYLTVHRRRAGLQIKKRPQSLDPVE